MLERRPVAKYAFSTSGRNRVRQIRFFNVRSQSRSRNTLFRRSLKFSQKRRSSHPSAVGARIRREQWPGDARAGSRPGFLRQKSRSSMIYGRAHNLILPNWPISANFLIRCRPESLLITACTADWFVYRQTPLRHVSRRQRDRIYAPDSIPLFPER
jgi:hypothetical protein